MKHKIISIIVLSLFFCSTAGAQELNCEVTVNADRIPNSNRTIFKNLERSLADFINHTKWTNQVYEQNEKIECSIFINLTEYSSDVFIGTIQVQSSRPVFDSGYSTTVFNYNDKDFHFRYQEFEKLNFDPNTFDSNLISTIAFYAYFILGLDADTFELNGGTPFFEIAQNITNVAQQSSYKGWKQDQGTVQNRYFLISNILSGVYAPYRQAMYQYHFEGLDLMSDAPKEAKENIKKALMTLSQLHKVKPNAFLTRIFFDAKADEIVAIFKGGPKINVSDLLDILNRIAPLNSAKWNNITY